MAGSERYCSPALRSGHIWITNDRYTPFRFHKRLKGSHCCYRRSQREKASAINEMNDLMQIRTGVTNSLAAKTELEIDNMAIERFANLALACVHKEYPNKISHSLNSDGDVAPPRKLTPAFYGCYDWHSSVHGHWLLVRLVKIFPKATFVARAREALRRNLTAENLVQEAAYVSAEGRASFERPLGLHGCCNS